MSVELVSEIWGEVKRYVNSVDRVEAAETLVSVLIDNDVSVEEIRDAFKGDADIKRALSEYLQDHHDEDEDDEDDDYEYDDYE